MTEDEYLIAVERQRIDIALHCLRGCVHESIEEHIKAATKSLCNAHDALYRASLIKEEQNDE